MVGDTSDANVVPASGTQPTKTDTGKQESLAKKKLPLANRL
jgi:hypothetical protein